MTDFNRRIHRSRLHREMQLPDKIPRDHVGTYFRIPVYSDCASREPHSYLKVIVKAGVEPMPRAHGRGMHKSSTHRVFVECGCKRLIPAGRYHQHAGSCDQSVPTNQMALYERIDTFVGYKWSWDNIEKSMKMSGCPQLYHEIEKLTPAEKQEVRDGTRYITI